MNIKTSIVPVLAIIATLLIAGCTAYSGKGDTGAESTQPETPATGAITGQTKEFTVEGSEFKFSPNAISVNKGDSVKITFKNVGTKPHNFIIDELDVATKTINGGETDTVEFTASKSGTFAFYCSVGSHRANGMEGTATVA